ncbi:cyclic di-AMP binding protein CbpA [Lacticaseibacillus sp. GG6-2]
MLIKSLVLKKEFLTTVKETVTLSDALKILEDSGFRCVPILDESGQIFRGNIYKMHLYRHKSQGGDMSLPVTYLLKNATKTIPINAPFFKVFFNIKDLPYIAVLDENANFYGILTHSSLLAMLSESWHVDVGSYVLTVTSSSGPSGRGDLATMSKILAKYTDLASAITLDAKGNEALRRTLFTLPAGTSETTLNTVVAKLERKGYEVVEIDDLQSGLPLRSDE